MATAIKIENVSKLYRLGTVGTGTLSHDINRWWHRIRGKEDPYAKIGQVNDRTAKSSAASSQSSETAAAENGQLKTADSQASSPEYVWALKDINLEVAQGEILGIIGRNGAGKSTLLKLLSRVTAPTTGSIKTRGRIASLLEVGTGFHPELTGRENIYLNGAILGMKRHEVTAQLDEIVDFSGCAKYLDTPVKRYSSGMKVRLGFAVAAYLECEVLIVDEVLAVGDASFQKRCIEKMRSNALAGKTVLFVSHNASAIRALCPHSVLLDVGRICFRGPTGEVLKRYWSQDSSSPAQHRRKSTCGDPADSILLCGVKITNEVNESVEVFPSDSPVIVSVSFEINTYIPNIKAGFAIKDEWGATLFEVFSSDVAPWEPARPMEGLYRIKAIIPGNLLNAGTFVCCPRIGIDRDRWIVEENNGPRFRVELSLPNRQAVVVRREGAVVPILTWEVEKIPKCDA